MHACMAKDPPRPGVTARHQRRRKARPGRGGMVRHSVGDKVEARYRGGKKWFPGSVRSVDVVKDLYELQFSIKGKVVWEKDVPGAFVRLPKPRTDRDTLNSDDDASHYTSRTGRSSFGSGQTEFTDDGVRFTEGQRIEARYRGNDKFFPGLIRGVKKGGLAYDIEYDVGGWERGVKKFLIRAADGDRAARSTSDSAQSVSDPGASGQPASAPKFPVGTRVEARYRRGARWFAGTIRRVSASGLYDVDYDMAGALEKDLPEDMVRPAESDAAHPHAADARERRPSGLVASAIPEDAVKLESPRHAR